MTTEKIFVSDPKKNFTDILNESEFNGFIPTNYIINKKRPGLGCTHNELLALRNSIIIEPYIAVIEVKKVKMEARLCAVMGKMTMKQVKERITTYMNDTSIPYKKFMTTPESFYKVTSILKRFDSEYQKNYFLLIDECEKWIKQAIFRSKMLKPLDDFFQFDNKAMISATPVIPSDERFQQQGFKVLELQPTFDYKKDIKVITTNNIRTSCRNQLSLFTDGLPIFVFTNCRDTIYYLTQLDSVKSDYKVFCAEDLDIRFFQTQELPNVVYSNKEQQYARYNFVTSRFFSAVDFDLPTQAHILMISNVEQAQHTILDPATDSIQIYGRCRRNDKLITPTGVKSATHITNIYSNYDIISKEAILQDASEEISLISRLNVLMSKSSGAAAKVVVNSLKDKLFANEVFNEDDSVNDFKKDNLIDSRSVKSYYYSESSLLKEYQECGFFNVIWFRTSHTFSDLDRLKIKKAKNRKRREEVAKQLHLLILTNQASPLDKHEYKEERERLKDADEFIFNAYFELGFDELSKLAFNKTEIMEAIFNLKKQEGKNCMLMLDKIITTFPLNVKLYSDDIKDKLQSIYNEFNYEKSPGVIHKAKGADITIFFDCKLHNGKHKVDGAYKSWYKLYAAKDKISKDLQYLTNR